MSVEENVRVMREIFSAIERRDAQRVLDLCDPHVEFHWPPSLPYGGITYGRDQEVPSWGKTWVPLQPTEAERRMDPRVVAASDDEVVVLWHQRGRSPTGESCDGEVLALYKLRDGKLIRGQMFYFDTAATNTFLARVQNQAKPQNRKAASDGVLHNVVTEDCCGKSVSASVG